MTYQTDTAHKRPGVMKYLLNTSALRFACVLQNVSTATCSIERKRVFHDTWSFTGCIGLSAPHVVLLQPIGKVCIKWLLFSHTSYRLIKIV